MRLLYKHTATLSRVDGEDTWSPTGDLIPASRTESEFKCVIHPPTKKSVYQNDLPEGITFADYQEIRTATPLFPTNDETKTNADHIIWKGETYVVFIANPYPSPSDRLQHYEGIIIKKDYLG